MQLQLDSLSTLKIYLHLTQAILLFLTMVLTIAVFTQSGKSYGSTIWFFILCWVTIPILVFQAMVPQWSRAQRFNSPYAFASLDGLAAFLWLTAWAAVAAYVSEGKKRSHGGGGSCDTFGYGTASKCKLSEATIFFGLLIMGIFVATFFISFRGVIEYRRSGTLPAAANMGGTFGNKTEFTAVEGQEEGGAWASNMNAHDDDAEAYPQQHGGQPMMGREGMSAYQPPSYEDEYVQMPTADRFREHDRFREQDHDLSQMHPQEPTSPLDHQGLGLQSMDTAYHGGQRVPPVSSGYGGLGRTGTGR